MQTRRLKGLLGSSYGLTNIANILTMGMIVVFVAIWQSSDFTPKYLSPDVGFASNEIALRDDCIDIYPITTAQPIASLGSSTRASTNSSAPPKSNSA